MGIHHDYAHHRLSVQIEVPSRGSISKKRSVCLYKFGLIIFSKKCLLQHTENSVKVSVYFFRYLFDSENMVVLCYHDSLITPINLVCSCETQIFKKEKISCFFMQICSEDIDSYLKNLNFVK